MVTKIIIVAVVAAAVIIKKRKGKNPQGFPSGGPFCIDICTLHRVY